ncbi:hypothetical protein [Actinoplanes sp. L3-i22]|uniref:hypothetical protein n=1 Tax=Actinoplanes sp. L3-i22 TaxID=2836373 RepID=UPI001C779A27|nr:hypothetical protein [Actinoplanes sp. L3-i22]BCY05744.1 hypothetical protein L3i22_008320 [Actinoplanes sp. L3-i22]
MPRYWVVDDDTVTLHRLAISGRYEMSGVVPLADLLAAPIGEFLPEPPEISAEGG